MELKELKAFAAQNDNFEIRVISNGSGNLYQLELEDVEGQRHMLTRNDKPLLFRAPEEAYAELKHAGIRHAYLVQHGLQDEASGGGATHCQDLLSSRMPLVF